MDDGRIEDTSDSFLLVDDLGIELTCYAVLKTCGVFAVLKEGLSCNLVDILSGRIAVYSMEELVILTSDDSGITRAELVIEVAFFVVIYCVIRNQKRCGDETFFVLKNCLAACESAV